jgi:succinylarginine dihydrolase
LQLSVVPVRWQSAASQQTPPAQAWSLQRTVHSLPTHSMVSEQVPGEQLTLVWRPSLAISCLQEPVPLQSTWQVSVLEAQRSSLPQLSTPLQCKSHFAASHVTLPAHEPLPSQRTSQLLEPQRTSSAQLPSVSQSTTQATPSGHSTRSRHGFAALHVITQAPSRHSPMPAQAASHAADETGAPPLASLPPVEAPPLPPVPRPPPVPDSPPLKSSGANKSFFGALPHAAATDAQSTTSAHTPPQRATAPKAIAGESIIEKALCSARMREHQFDGLVGPTHHYAGLSPGNLASQQHAGEVSNPRAAALEGLAKMRHVRALGVAQAVLPPQPRPDLATLRRLGFSGSDRTVLERALCDAPELLHAVSSASSMWAANAATVVPSADALDGKTHFVPANLVSLLHRSLEPAATTRVLRRIFGDDTRFVVHDPLPASSALGDEGAANHTRMSSPTGSLHLFGWGQRLGQGSPTAKHPARQSYAASAAVARTCRLDPARVLLWQQAPLGIDAGAFHTDVLAVGTGSLLLLHEHAFLETESLLRELSARLGPSFRAIVARESELPLADAVAAYPFNSQLLELANGGLRLVAPREAQRNSAARGFLERAMAEAPELGGVDYLDVNGSMRNGGGPACLRLRVPLTPDESASLRGRVLLDEQLERELEAIVTRRYRERLELADLADPALLNEARTALDELTQALGLGSVYEFQH